MALSTRTKRILEISMADRKASAELATAIDLGGNPQAAAVALLGATVDLSVPAGGAAGLADPILAADVNAALDDKAEQAEFIIAVSEIEGRLDAIEAKVDAVISAFKAAGLMA